MEKLTDAEIKKALECCSKAQCEQDCVVLGCPYYLEEQCSNKIVVDALDLINRKDAKIERLMKEQVEKELFEGNHYSFHNGKLYAIPKTEEKQMKSEAYKECVERVKQVFGRNNVFETCVRLIVDSILNELTQNLHGTCTEGGNEDG